MPASLESLARNLRKGRLPGRDRYRIPGLWLEHAGKSPSRETVSVEPHDFYAEVLDRLAAGPAAPAPGPLGEGSLLYLALLRHIVAFDHDGDGTLGIEAGDLGTTLKGFVLLAHLARMGVTDLILLPMTPASTAFKKGTLGSPYAVRNPAGIDPFLADPLLADEDPAEVFRLFVATAHRLGMRVLFDIVPRTSARDSDLLLEHPEWFYWIDRAMADRFAAPRYEEIAKSSAPLPEWIPMIYSHPATREVLAMFRPDPSRHEGWDRFVGAARARGLGGEALLDEIARHFGVFVPPAFSDCVNDTQPPWSDVTYLRLYLDAPEAAAALLAPGQAPYFLHDVAKASRFPGREANGPLWRRIERILPDFVRDFDIDGVRVDMGHALPPDLERRMREAARAEKPDFIFIAEEFSLEEAARFAEKGYQAFIGNAWWFEPRADDPERRTEFEKWLLALADLPIPFWATAETPDTPRAHARARGDAFARFSLLLNHFLPNAIPAISGGFELGETVPLNTGLDFTAEEIEAFRGRLAFFDPYSPDWTRHGAIERIREIASLKSTRALPPPRIVSAAAGEIICERGGTRLAARPGDWRAEIETEKKAQVVEKVRV